MTQATQTIQDFFAQELPHAEDRWVELSVMLSQEIGAERERPAYQHSASWLAVPVSRCLICRGCSRANTTSPSRPSPNSRRLWSYRYWRFAVVKPYPSGTRGLAGHPTAAQGRTAKLRAILEDEEHHWPIIDPRARSKRWSLPATLASQWPPDGEFRSKEVDPSGLRAR